VKRVLLIAVLLFSNLYSYHTFEVNMNSEELESRVDLDLAQFINSYEVERYFAGVDYLYIENSGSEGKNSSDSMTSLNLMVKGHLENFKPLTFGLGMKPFIADMGDRDIQALPLGLLINLRLPIRTFPISFSSSFYYSPKPLTFNDGDEYFEQRYEFAIELIKRGEIVVGYRDMEFSVVNGEKDEYYKFSQMGYVGIRIGF
jgi:hypothetical protein